MTPLISKPTQTADTKTQLNVAAPPANTANTQPVLSPSAMSALTASGACGLVGLMSSQPKYDFNKLLELDKDTFEKQTKSITKLDEANPLKKALNKYLDIKKEIQTETDKYVEKIFKGKDTIKIRKGHVDKGLEAVEQQLLNMKDASADSFTKLVEKHKNYSILSRLASSAQEGQITKESAKNIIKRSITDYKLDDLSQHYSEFARKLPKARIKSAAKFFGIGLATIVATDFIFGLFRKKN